jgi:T5orf172 domain
MLGYVYVVTTESYQKRSIFKIGFSTNLGKRLKLFNATRMDDDLFYCVRNWKTTHYSKLEAFLHTHLHEYRKKNEFFQVSLDLIEEGVKRFAETNGPHAFHQDVVLIQSQVCKVEFVPHKNIFVFENGNGMTSATDIEMREIVRLWLSCVDNHGLVRFMSTDAIARLVTLLKTARTRDKEEEVQDLSREFRRLRL